MIPFTNIENSEEEILLPNINLSSENDINFSKDFVDIEESEESEEVSKTLPTKKLSSDECVDYFRISNLFNELKSEYQKQTIRKNLNISEENTMFWGNMKGFPEDQKDLVELIQDKIEDNFQQILNESPETLKTLQQITKFLKEDPDGATQLLNQVIKNSEQLSKVKYLSQSEYDDLVANNLIEDDVEYNIFESE